MVIFIEYESWLFIHRDFRITFESWLIIHSDLCITVESWLIIDGDFLYVRIMANHPLRPSDENHENQDKAYCENVGKQQNIKSKHTSKIF